MAAARKPGQQQGEAHLPWFGLTTPEHDLAKHGFCGGLIGGDVGLKHKVGDAGFDLARHAFEICDYADRPLALSPA